MSTHGRHRRKRVRFGIRRTFVLSDWLKSRLLPALLLFLSLPASAESELQLSEAEREWIAANPVVRAHNELDWPPFNFNEDGRPMGYSIEYMQRIAALAGLEIEFVSGPTWRCKRPRGK